MVGHINAVVSKASKRLHILWVLCRGGLPAEDLLIIYNAIIRSVLEYCCAVWHHALPLYLSQYIVRVQKRAFRIILPGFHYKEALNTLCTILFERREQICLKTIKKICERGPLLKNIPVFRNSIHGITLEFRIL